MLKENVLNELNKQINAELYSAYLSMSAFFEKRTLKGFSNWLKVQAKRELSHAMKFYYYIVKSGAKVSVSPKKWSSPLEAFDDIFSHKKKASNLINELTDLVAKRKDKETYNELKWFLKEQEKDEIQTNEIAQKLKFVKEGKSSLSMIDGEFAEIIVM